jgi:hypothetical protein
MLSHSAQERAFSQQMKSPSKGTAPAGSQLKVLTEVLCLLTKLREMSILRLHIVARPAGIRLCRIDRVRQTTTGKRERRNGKARQGSRHCLSLSRQRSAPPHAAAQRVATITGPPVSNMAALLRRPT